MVIALSVYLAGVAFWYGVWNAERTETSLVEGRGAVFLLSLLWPAMMWLYPKGGRWCGWRL